jgi:hypothetical protein
VFIDSIRVLVSIDGPTVPDCGFGGAHSHIVFMIDHLGFAKIVGLFSDFSGTLSFDPNNVSAGKLNVTIKTESLQTQFAPRDKDLKGADWFNTTEFPEITYVGSQFAKKDDHTGTIRRNASVCKLGRSGSSPFRSAWPSARYAYQKISERGSSFGSKRHTIMIPLF